MKSKMFSLIFALLLTVIALPSTSYAGVQCSLTDIGAYKFMERLGYEKLFSNEYKTYQGANIYTATLPLDNMPQNSPSGNILMFVYPNTGQLAQVSLIFNLRTYTMNNVVFAAKVMNAIEGEAYVEDKFRVETIMLNLLNSYGVQELVELKSYSMNRKYGFLKEIRGDQIYLTIKAVSLE